MAGLSEEVGLLRVRLSAHEGQIAALRAEVSNLRAQRHVTAPEAASGAKAAAPDPQVAPGPLAALPLIALPPSLRRVYDLLAAHGPMSGREVARRLGYRTSGAPLGVLHQLLAGGHIVRTATRGRYQGWGLPATEVLRPLEERLVEVAASPRGLRPGDGRRLRCNPYRLRALAEDLLRAGRLRWDGRAWRPL